MVLSFLESGAIHLAVETIFRQDKDMTDKERDQIRQVVDLYEMGRDPWLRGFERAGARDVAHERKGPERALEGIIRKATLPAVESLSVVMPDAIANFKLVRDEGRGSTTLSIVHTDVPASIRDNRRRMQREIGQFSGSLFVLSERECDLYDYLARYTDRRPAVLKGLLERDQVDEVLDPVLDRTVSRGRRPAWRFRGSRSERGDPRDRQHVILRLR